MLSGACRRPSRLLAGGLPRLVWRTEERGKRVEYETEPGASAWWRMKVDLLSRLPLDRER